MDHSTGPNNRHRRRPEAGTFIDPRALTGSMASYLMPHGPHLLERLRSHHDWLELRRRSGTLPYSKALTTPALPEATVLDGSGVPASGVNFGSQDYLSLSSHPAIRRAAHAAIETMGVHSAGSPALMGNTRQSLNLERLICHFTGYRHSIVFPTGWAAGYGVVRALVTPRDHVIIDRLGHACLQEGARSATRKITRVAHLDSGQVEDALRTIRSDDQSAGILVVTESLFSMDSDTPNLRALQDLCRQYGATLLVDCAHDLGCLGPTGRGALETQGMVGQVDILMGSFSKTFASNGGFVASNHPALRSHLRFASNPQTFSNAMSPVQAAIVAAAFKIVASEEGALRRERLTRNVRAVRHALSEAGFEVLGSDSPIVPVVLGNTGYSRVFCVELMRLGALTNLVEFPAVAQDASRLRLQVMADHEPWHIERLVSLMDEARERAASFVARAFEATSEPQRTLPVTTKDAPCVSISTAAGASGP